ncbi:MAG TPA: phage terminase large subunit family protein [Rhizomicrobium sp.]
MWRSGLAPDPVLSVSEWADEYRILPSQSSAEPGEYRTDRAPFNRAIMDALSATTRYTRIVFMKSTQVGATEDGNNWIGYGIHQLPAPFLAVLPTLDLAKRASKQRIEPMIEATPSLRERVAPARKRDSNNTVLVKSFPGGILIMTGANSAAGLRSMPARFLFFDEIDAYPADIDEEGDPIKLAERRAQTFGHRRKVFLVSTPTTKGFSRIEIEFEATDQQRYFVPCPHCKEKQWLKFDRLIWERGDPDSVRYKCEHCDRELEEHHKTWMLENGEWRATAQCADKRVIGFHISALYSPIGWMSWAEIAKEWEEAQGNEALLKTFTNTIKGETFQERGDAPDWKLLVDRKREHSLGKVPAWARLLTAGVDVQRDRLEVDIWAWGFGVESALIEHVVLEGDTSKDEVWTLLHDLLPKRIARDGDESDMLVSRWAIDVGDGATTAQARLFVRKHPGLTIAVIGRPGQNVTAPVQGPTYVEVTERGRKIKRGVKIYKIHVDVFKAETYRFLRLDRPTDEELAKSAEFPDGYMHLADGLPDEWFKQLTAEQLVVIKGKRKKAFPRQEWQKLRERNEALDCRVYARAAAWLLGVDRWPSKKELPKPQPPKGGATRLKVEEPEKQTEGEEAQAAASEQSQSSEQERRDPPKDPAAAIRERFSRISGRFKN